jgi:hypothetical protein
MTETGQKLTFRGKRIMSALPPKADKRVTTTKRK